VSESLPVSLSFPVLGLFRNEAELRDHIAARLAELEPGLVLTKTKYQLDSPSGAGGRVDILALDDFDRIVITEMKRGDRSARSTLHELTKYISLLVGEARVLREAVRCMVLSTDWHELLLPLSFFAATAGVHVEGVEVRREADSLAYRPVQLTPISDLPQFSPEISI
jgi:Endonuclease NucS